MNPKNLPLQNIVVMLHLYCLFICNFAFIGLELIGHITYLPKHFDCTIDKTHCPGQMQYVNNIGMDFIFVNFMDV